MLCLEVYRNGEKLCTAGIGEFGLLDARVMWLSHEPEMLARRAADGRSPRQPVTLDLAVGGAVGDGTEFEHLDWVKEALAVGDEIRILVVDTDAADAPATRRKEEDPSEESLKEFVRRQAGELGWTISE